MAGPNPGHDAAGTSTPRQPFPSSCVRRNSIIGRTCSPSCSAAARHSSCATGMSRPCKNVSHSAFAAVAICRRHEFCASAAAWRSHRRPEAPQEIQYWPNVLAELVGGLRPAFESNRQVLPLEKDAPQRVSCSRDLTAVRMCRIRHTWRQNRRLSRCPICAGLFRGCRCWSGRGRRALDPSQAFADISLEEARRILLHCPKETLGRLHWEWLRPVSGIHCLLMPRHEIIEAVERKLIANYAFQLTGKALWQIVRVR